MTPHTKTYLARAGIVVALLGLAPGAGFAARPLAVDDTGILDVATCQFEAWQDRDPDTQALHLAPSCGILPGLEINFDAVRGSPRSEQPAGRFLGFRWSPDFAHFENWQLGLNTGWLRERPAGTRSWQATEWAATLMASRPLSDDVTVLLNLGHTHMTAEEGLKRTTYGMALMWTPHPRWMVFAEALGAVRQDTDLGAGLRYWLIPEVLGLDATATRTTTRDANTVWGVGFGWYGIRF